MGKYLIETANFEFDDTEAFEKWNAEQPYDDRRGMSPGTGLRLIRLLGDGWDDEIVRIEDVGDTTIRVTLPGGRVFEIDAGYATGGEYISMGEVTATSCGCGGTQMVECMDGPVACPDCA